MKRRATISLFLMLSLIVLLGVGSTDPDLVSADSRLPENFVKSLAPYINAHEKPPIVLVHGWRGLDPDTPCSPVAPDPSDYPTDYWLHLDEDLAALGFSVTYAKLITGFGIDGSISGCSPIAEENVPHLLTAIDQALAANPGQDKVILIAHSMGGLVSRAYLESANYRDDVVELYTLGTPHLGVPISGLVLLIEAITLGTLNLSEFCTSQPVVCQFSDDEALVQGAGFSGIATFNTIHHQRRAGVHYHLIGGDADFDDRSSLGIIMDSVISPAPDDGIVPRDSATGINSFNNNLGPLPGTYERRETYELHVESFADDPGLFDSPQRKYTYFTQDEYQVDCPFGICGEPYRTEQLLSESYATCLEPVIHARQPDHRCSDGVIFPPAAPKTPPSQPQAMAPAFFETLTAGQSTTRSIWLEGGQATLFARSEEGSKLDVSLRAPDGTTIEVNDARANPDILVKAEENATVFRLLEAQPGEWQLLIKAIETPPGGAKTMTWANYDSSVAMMVQIDHGLYRPDQPGTLTVRLAGAPSSATMEAWLGSGAEARTITLTGKGNLYSGTFSAPSQAGYHELGVRVSGVTAAGIPFEQERRNVFPVASEAFRLTGKYQDSIQPALNRKTGSLDLVVDVGVNATAAGKVGVSADLFDSQGNFITTSNAFGTIEAGDNTLELRFRGRDLLQAGYGDGGAYSLRNVRLVDYSTGGIITETVEQAYTTTRYNRSRFASPAPNPPLEPGFALTSQTPRIHDSTHTCTVTPSNDTGSNLTVGDTFQVDFTLNLDNGDHYPEWLDYYYVTGPPGWTMSEQSPTPPNAGGWTEPMTQTFNSTAGLAYWGFDYLSLADLDLATSVLPEPGTFWGPWRPDTGTPYHFSLTYAVPEAIPTCPGSAFVGMPVDGQQVTGVGVGDLVNNSLSEVSCTLGGYVCPLPTVSLTVTASPDGTCPGSMTVTIPEDNQTVTFCYTLANTSNAVAVVDHSLTNSLIDDQTLILSLEPGSSHSFSTQATLNGRQGNCYANEVTWTAVTETGYGQQQSVSTFLLFLNTTYQATDHAVVTVCVGPPTEYLIYLPLIKKTVDQPRRSGLKEPLPGKTN